jgi:hypothetical protein
MTQGQLGWICWKIPSTGGGRLEISDDVTLGKMMKTAAGKKGENIKDKEDNRKIKERLMVKE